MSQTEHQISHTGRHSDWLVPHWLLREQSKSTEAFTLFICS